MIVMGLSTPSLAQNETIARQVQALKASLDSFSSAMEVKNAQQDTRMQIIEKKAANLEKELGKSNACISHSAFYQPDADNADDGGCVSLVAHLQDNIEFVANVSRSNVSMVQCPEHSIRLSCAGARAQSMQDTCDEEDCGFIGVKPIAPNGCAVSADTPDNHPSTTVWATCLKNPFPRR